KKSPEATITAPPLNTAEAKVAPFRRNFFHILIHSNLFSAEDGYARPGAYPRVAPKPTKVVSPVSPGYRRSVLIVSRSLDQPWERPRRFLSEVSAASSAWLSGK
ncbi:hypothetical protein K0M31_012388, partial [Melipona bicolor]